MIGDRLQRAIEGAIRALVPVDYLAIYPCKVIAQQANGSLDLRPERAGLPDLSGVPIRCGLPGCKVTVAAGARVLVGFEGGRPDAPYAALWVESAPATKIEIDGEIVFNAGTAEVARKGDAVGTLSGTTAAGPVTFTYTPPGAAPSVGPTVSLEVSQGAAQVKA